MFLCDFDKQKEIAEIARQALLRERVYAKENPKISVLNEAVQKLKSADFAKSYYDPFDETMFEGKVAVDLLYYKHLLRNLDESYSKDVQELLAQTYRNVKNIYEFVNIKPCIYGKGVTTSILENSLEQVETKLTEVINEALDIAFYSLPPEKRADKYNSKAIPLANKLVTESNDPEESLQYAIKACVLEEVLTKIAFPGANWLRVKHLTESEDFGLIFDQEKLVEIVETFEKQINTISKYLAACV